MTIPQIYNAAYEKLKSIFGKTKADAMEDEVEKAHPLNRVAQAEALAKKAGIEIPRPTGNYVPPSPKQASTTNVEANASAAEIAELRVENARLKSEHKIEVDKLRQQLDQLERHTEDAIARRAMEISISQGNVSPMCFQTSSNPSAAPGNKEKLWAEYHSLTGEARNDFYKANRSAMKD